MTCYLYVRTILKARDVTRNANYKNSFHLGEILSCNKLKQPILKKMNLTYTLQIKHVPCMFFSDRKIKVLFVLCAPSPLNGRIKRKGTIELR